MLTMTRKPLSRKERERLDSLLQRTHLQLIEGAELEILLDRHETYGDEVPECLREMFTL